MSTLLQRTLSGAVYVAVIVVSILEPTGIAFPVVAAILTVLGIREFLHLTGKDTWLLVMTSISGICMQAFVALAGKISKIETIDDLYLGLLMIPFGICILIAFIVTIAELFRKQENPMKNWGRYWQAVMMIALPFACMNFLLALRPYYLLALFISVWVNDTGAYLIGSATARLPHGNHKMLPRVSPAKSWEGLIGGILFTLAAGYVFYRIGWIDNVKIALVWAVSAGLFGTLGDLLESLMKRTVGVKDSGRFMPGHGGVLDRFDSMLLAAPCSLIVILLCQL